MWSLDGEGKSPVGQGSPEGNMGPRSRHQQLGNLSLEIQAANGVTSVPLNLPQLQGIGVRNLLPVAA